MVCIVVSSGESLLCSVNRYCLMGIRPWCYFWYVGSCYFLFWLLLVC